MEQQVLEKARVEAGGVSGDLVTFTPSESGAHLRTASLAQDFDRRCAQTAVSMAQAGRLPFAWLQTHAMLFFETPIYNVQSPLMLAKPKVLVLTAREVTLVPGEPRELGSKLRGQSRCSSVIAQDSPGDPSPMSLLY
eukprot:3625840-Rhodomonas_salina.1